ncbi:hypothetical protein AAHA92_33770 [Salvia divinorum]|uniref:Uncharacterized protein n=1 Tax=Salvia divinorum TaxID=28513 RepID=A0ABD1FK61_SALDI
MTDFAEMVEDSRLMDPGFDGAQFTWANNTLVGRLDRVFINEAWLDVFEGIRVNNLARVASVHGPVLMRCKLPFSRNRGSAFRFHNMWIRHPGFLPLVREEWERPTEETGLLKLQQKLARLKKALKGWNKDVFGNIQANLREAEEAVNVENPTSSNRTEINKLIAQYILLLKMEEDFWRQKATIRWLSEGDQNTKFYQSWVRQKRTRLHISIVFDRMG